MKTPVLMLAAVMAVSAVQASAATVEDTDGNGSYSLEEMIVAYPELTDGDFAEMDADESGDISEDELTAAMENGVLAN
ncbi:MAG: EF-hand domain-containing protein [Rhodobacteraceae bacterium]|jgi:hypothetical protein|nr:EF-hand domain-containing protein [Paracoccaceae bacterium]